MAKWSPPGQHSSFGSPLEGTCISSEKERGPPPHRPPHHHAYDPECHTPCSGGGLAFCLHQAVRRLAWDSHKSAMLLTAVLYLGITLFYRVNHISTVVYACSDGNDHLAPRAVNTRFDTIFETIKSDHTETREGFFCKVEAARQLVKKYPGKRIVYVDADMVVDLQAVVEEVDCSRMTLFLHPVSGMHGEIVQTSFFCFPADQNSLRVLDQWWAVKDSYETHPYDQTAMNDFIKKSSVKVLTVDPTGIEIGHCSHAVENREACERSLTLFVYWDRAVVLVLSFVQFCFWLLPLSLAFGFPLIMPGIVGGLLDVNPLTVLAAFNIPSVLAKFLVRNNRPYGELNVMHNRMFSGIFLLNIGGLQRAWVPTIGLLEFPHNSTDMFWATAYLVAFLFLVIFRKTVDRWTCITCPTLYHWLVWSKAASDRCSSLAGTGRWLAVVATGPNLYHLCCGSNKECEVAVPVHRIHGEPHTYRRIQERKAAMHATMREREYTEGDSNSDTAIRGKRSTAHIMVQARHLPNTSVECSMSSVEHSELKKEAASPKQAYTLQTIRGLDRGEAVPASDVEQACGSPHKVSDPHLHRHADDASSYRPTSGHRQPLLFKKVARLLLTALIYISITQFYWLSDTSTVVYTCSDGTEHVAPRVVNAGLHTVFKARVSALSEHDCKVQGARAMVAEHPGKRIVYVDTDMVVDLQAVIEDIGCTRLSFFAHPGAHNLVQTSFFCFPAERNSLEMLDMWWGVRFDYQEQPVDQTGMNDLIAHRALKVLTYDPTGIEIAHCSPEVEHREACKSNLAWFVFWDRTVVLVWSVVKLCVWLLPLSLAFGYPLIMPGAIGSFLDVNPLIILAALGIPSVLAKFLVRNNRDSGAMRLTSQHMFSGFFVLDIGGWRPVWVPTIGLLQLPHNSTDSFWIAVYLVFFFCLVTFRKRVDKWTCITCPTLYHWLVWSKAASDRCSSLAGTGRWLAVVATGPNLYHLYCGSNRTGEAGVPVHNIHSTPAMYTRVEERNASLNASMREGEGASPDTALRGHPNTSHTNIQACQSPHTFSEQQLQ